MAIIVLGLLILIRLGSASVMLEVMFTQRTECSQFLFTDNVLFERSVRSKLSCARLCGNHPSCVSFTVAPGSSRTCRGHAGVVTLMSAKLASPGAMTYILRNDESTTMVAEVTTVTSSPSAQSAWLELSCDSDDDCTAGSNTQCYEGQCNCIPGYYFSVSADSCVINCNEADLGTGFTFYYNGNIPTMSIGSQTGLGVQECFNFCLSTTTPCRSIDYRPGDGACYPADKTAMEAGWNPVTTGGHNHYQRFCA